VFREVWNAWLSTKKVSNRIGYSKV
jgi:hypothetical protein